MPTDTSIVEPKAGLQLPAAPEDGQAELPEDVIKIPAMQALMVGQPGAFSASLADMEKSPEAKLLVKHKDALLAAGFGLYRSLDGAKGAVFNQLFVSPQQIQDADKAGQLETVAPPFAELNASVASAGAANPVLAQGERPTGFAMGGGGGGEGGGLPPMAAMTPPPQQTQDLAVKRANAITSGPPASGAKPGAGRLVNSILKNVV